MNRSWELKKRKCMILMAAHAVLHIFILFCSHPSFAGCVVLNSDRSVTSPKADLLYATLAQAPECPRSVQELQGLLDRGGTPALPALVANRGRNNPDLGSFSFFESVPRTSSDKRSPQVLLFFGHFTTLENGVVRLDQDTSIGRLMVELMAWDSVKGYYNFYELIGTGTSGTWFYRGDSRDILKDNENLYLGLPGDTPRFGNRLRCSACHSSGGPILKELTFPHNDWWSSERPLHFGKNQLSPEILKKLEGVLDANRFAAYVKNGIQTLTESPSYRALKRQMPNRVQLRTLFCDTEINLESSLSASGLETVLIPSAAILNPLLGKFDFRLPAPSYQSLLRSFQMRFPETQLLDADHPWLVPVKGVSDLAEIQTLIRARVIDLEFATDVLAVDMENPLFSAKRCQLLRLVPDGPHWKREFERVLGFSTEPGAQELLHNLKDPLRNRLWHLQRADWILRAKAAQLDADGGKKEFKNLLRLRRSVFESEISKSKRGQILEPGFRLIFPEPRVQEP